MPRPSPQHFQVWLDHPRLGCGWRAFLLLREGHKYATLICTENAEPLTIPLAEWRTLERKPLPLSASRLARRLRALGKTYSRETRLLSLAIALLKPTPLQ